MEPTTGSGTFQQRRNVFMIFTKDNINPQHNKQHDLLSSQRTQCIHCSHGLINSALVTTQDTFKLQRMNTAFISQTSYLVNFYSFTQ